MEAWGFEYRTAAFVWVKKNRKSGGNFWGMGAYIVEAPVEQHSRKPAEVRERIVRLLGDVPRIELFARERVPGWDAWGNEV